MKNNIFIFKASGEKVPFSEEKYRRSLHRSGASDEEIEQVINKIRPLLHDGMSTKQLYKLTRQFLTKEKKHGVAGRYHLKQAIMKLGPSGFPFEKFVGALLKHQGYEVTVDNIVRGKCVDHEVDIIAIKDKERYIIECKFHHELGILSAIKTSLYVKARCDDIQEASDGKKYDRCWLVTNTRFSSNAIQYGECVNLSMLAWSYPQGNGLERMIDAQGLYPITCLSSLSRYALRALFQENIVLCCDLLKKENFLGRLNLKEAQRKKILEEVRAICAQK